MSESQNVKFSRFGIKDLISRIKRTITLHEIITQLGINSVSDQNKLRFLELMTVLLRLRCTVTMTLLFATFTTTPQLQYYTCTTLIPHVNYSRTLCMNHCIQVHLSEL